MSGLKSPPDVATRQAAKTRLDSRLSLFRSSGISRPRRYAATLVAMRAARKADFLDRPYGYKGHREPTPYLGGAAVLLAFSLALAAMSGVSGRTGIILACTAGLAVVGALDDRWLLAPHWRIAAELAGAVILWSSHLGFTVFSSNILNLVLTILWVTGVANAFNLFDNMDGACATVTAASVLGIAAFALAYADAGTAIVAIALGAACLGFLPHNLAGPARIFLGDGGSLPLGFLVAALALSGTRAHGFGGTQLMACGLLAGLPVLDTTLVVVSRTRRGVSAATPGRDHLTHRLYMRLGTPGRVALAMAVVQVILDTFAITGALGGRALLIGFGLGASSLACASFCASTRRRGTPRSTCRTLRFCHRHRYRRVTGMVTTATQEAPRPLTTTTLGRPPGSTSVLVARVVGSRAMRILVLNQYSPRHRRTCSAS